MLLSSGERCDHCPDDDDLTRARDTGEVLYRSSGWDCDEQFSHQSPDHQSLPPIGLKGTLADGVIPIVAGFQGINESSDVTTLGRGGSDLTAVALAAALEADRCVIYTDVEGVYTADPRIVPHARRLEKLSYEEMLELASMGAKVLQARSVEFAAKLWSAA